MIHCYLCKAVLGNEEVFGEAVKNEDGNYDIFQPIHAEDFTEQSDVAFFSLHRTFNEDRRGGKLLAPVDLDGNVIPGAEIRCVVDGVEYSGETNKAGWTMLWSNNELVYKHIEEIRVYYNDKLVYTVLVGDNDYFYGGLDGPYVIPVYKYADEL